MADPKGPEGAPKGSSTPGPESGVGESPIDVLVGIAVELIPDAAIAEIQAIGGAPRPGPTPEPLARRSYVRAVFAAIEGMNFARLYLATNSTHFTLEARARADIAAREQKAAANKARAGPAVATMLASFAAFAAAHEVQNPLESTGSEWATYLRAKKIRDRVTHPKSAADCRVSEADFKLVRSVHQWYQNLDVRSREGISGGPAGTATPTPSP